MSTIRARSVAHLPLCMLRVRFEIALKTPTRHRACDAQHDSSYRITASFPFAKRKTFAFAPAYASPTISPLLHHRLTNAKVRHSPTASALAKNQPGAPILRFDALSEMVVLPDRHRYRHRLAPLIICHVPAAQPVVDASDWCAQAWAAHLAIRLSILVCRAIVPSDEISPPPPFARSSSLACPLSPVSQRSCARYQAFRKQLLASRQARGAPPVTKNCFISRNKCPADPPLSKIGNIHTTARPGPTRAAAVRVDLVGQRLHPL